MPMTLGGSSTGSKSVSVAVKATVTSGLISLAYLVYLGRSPTMVTRSMRRVWGQ
jgi:hypothetical protein